MPTCLPARDLISPLTRGKPWPWRLLENAHYPSAAGGSQSGPDQAGGEHGGLSWRQPRLGPLPQLANECFAMWWESHVQVSQGSGPPGSSRIIHPGIPTQESGSHTFPSRALTLLRSVWAVLLAPLSCCHPSSSILSLIFRTGSPSAAGGGSVFKQCHVGCGSSWPALSGHWTDLSMIFSFFKAAKALTRSRPSPPSLS